MGAQNTVQKPDAEATHNDADDDDEIADDYDIPQPIHGPPKVGRNETCPCGSGKKYKKCWGGLAARGCG